MLLLQVPPVTVVESVVEVPVHIDDVPEMLPALGNGLIVMLLVATAVEQDVATVYEITTLPDATPVTRPVASTVAIEELAEDHIPLVPVVVKLEVLPAQIGEVPEIVPASGLLITVTSLVAATVPQLLLTV